MSAPVYAVSIFSSRETPETLQASVEAVRLACGETPAIVDVLVNGQRALADAIAPWLKALRGGPETRLWFFALGDKPNTWNHYIEQIAPEATTHFFVDGYVRPLPDSLDAIHRRLQGDDEAWAATGVPSVGRSAKRQRELMLKHGGMQGNLFAFKGHVVERLRRTGLRIPLGLYRNDSLLASVVLFGGDPGANRWEDRRLVVVDGATWTNDVLSPWSLKSLETQWKRRVRQAQGDLENAAVRQHLGRERRRPETLPRTALALVDGWRQAAPDDAHALLKSALRRHAYRKMAVPRDWSTADDPPLRIA